MFIVVPEILGARGFEPKKTNVWITCLMSFCVANKNAALGAARLDEEICPVRCRNAYRHPAAGYSGRQLEPFALPCGVPCGSCSSGVSSRLAFARSGLRALACNLLGLGFCDNFTHCYKNATGRDSSIRALFLLVFFPQFGQLNMRA